MGIQGLLAFLRNTDENLSAVRPSHLCKFRGQRAAVDAYSWLHKGVCCCAQDLFLNKPTNKYVEYCVKNIKLLQDYGITPILVFDGDRMPYKIVEKQRRENRDNARAQANDLIAMGRMNEAWNQMVQSINVTHEMASQLMKRARDLGVESIVAPYEADAQLVFLENEHVVDFIISEDSDLIVFGGNKIFFKMDSTGRGEVFDVADIELCLRANRRLQGAAKFDFAKLFYAAILSGCDYLKNLPGVGIIKAWKFIQMTENPNVRQFLRKLPAYLKLSITVDDEYIEGFVQAVLAFRHQSVFNPREGKRVPLNKLSPDVDNSDYDRFAGRFKSVTLDHRQLALGNIDDKNVQYDNYEPPVTSYLYHGVVPDQVQKKTCIDEQSPVIGFKVDGIYKRRRELSRLSDGANGNESQYELRSQSVDCSKDPLQNDEELTQFYKNVDTSPCLKTPVKEERIEHPKKRIKCKFLRNKYNQSESSEPLQRSEFFRPKQSSTDLDSGIELSQESAKLKDIKDKDISQIIDICQENRNNLLQALKAVDLEEDSVENRINPDTDAENDDNLLSDDEQVICISPVIELKESPIIGENSLFGKEKLKEIQNVQKTIKVKKKILDKKQPTLLKFFAKV